MGGFPTKIDYRKQTEGTLILTSLLEDLDVGVCGCSAWLALLVGMCFSRMIH